MTDDAKFTKGPWKVIGATLEDDYIGFHVVAEGLTSSIANARLIAASPDLYEALYECATLLSALTGPDDAIATCVIDMARAALAKAVRHD